MSERVEAVNDTSNAARQTVTHTPDTFEDKAWDHLTDSHGDVPSWAEAGLGGLDV